MTEAMISAIPTTPTVGSRSIESKLHASAARNRELLQILRETDHARPDLENQKRLIGDFEQQLRESAQRMDELDRRRKKELKDHEKYQNSVMRRFAYKVSGKEEQFQEKAAKEEREWVEITQESYRESVARGGLEQMLRDAYGVKSGLDSAAERHRQAQVELDSLYDSIFQGPTPGFPEEDAREADAAYALSSYRSSRERCDAEHQALKLITAAQRRARDSVAALDAARGHSRMDMFGGGTMSDFFEKNELNKAECAQRDSRTYCVQAARQTQAVAVESLPPVTIRGQSMWGDVIFDNIVSDMRVHEEIKTSLAEASTYAVAVDALADASRRRLVELTDALQVTEVELESARLALQDARAQVFERTSEIIIP